MTGIVVYVFTVLITYVLGIVSKKTGFNEDLPIPIQNIIIGICSFIVMLVIDYFTGTEFELEELAKEIMFAIGGAGTATLAYDADKASK